MKLQVKLIQLASHFAIEGASIRSSSLKLMLSDTVAVKISLIHIMISFLHKGVKGIITQKYT